MEVQMQQMQMALIQAQIAKEQALAAKHNADAQAAGGRGMKDAAQADLNQAKAQEAGGKARKHGSEADKIDLDYLQEADGTKHQQALEAQDKKDGNKMLTELAKSQQGKENAE
jgi:hypothetical protein